jgi:hypothetical protein
MLEADATTKLQNAGIKVFRFGNEGNYQAGAPRLIIVATLDQLNGFNHPIETEVKLVETVRLVRDPSLEYDAVTWSTGGSAAPKLEIPIIQRLVANHVDRFIEHYLAVNPKPSANSGNAKSVKTKH